MKPHLYIVFIVIVLLPISYLMGQESVPEKGHKYKYVSIVDGNDTIPVYSLSTVYIFAPLKFKDEKELREYTRLVRDVKKTYPYARMIASSIIETYEYMESLPNDKERNKHMDEVKEYMMEKYKPEMKKMTKRQGQILMKLIDRECGSSSYDVVKAMVGSFKAGTYNIFAGLFGNSLKTRYEPRGRDAEIEAIVIQIQQGTLDYYFSYNYHHGLQK